MARQKYRGNTFSSAFPLISSFSGQSIIVPGIDQVKDERNYHQEIPHPIFLENVMPMANGFQSVAFSDKIISNEFSQDYDRAYYLRDAEERRTLYVPAEGKNYLYDPISRHWKSQPESVPFGAPVSTVNVKGRQFICFSHHTTFYEWDGSSLIPIQFAGLVAEEIHCLTAASAYLIAISERKVFWSSILDPTDFVPSLESGASSESVLSLKGDIIACTPLADGFMLYTSANMISASYTGNIRFPWVFKEVAGGAGIDSDEKVTNDSSGLNQFAYTTAGVMALDKNQAVPIWPQVSEFIASRRYEYYDYSMKKIIEKDINDFLYTKVAFVAKRYLVISYGDNELSFALIYDTSLKRWGKLAISHVDCFEYMEQPIAVQTGQGLRYKDIGGTYAAQERFYSSYGHLTYGPAITYNNMVGFYNQQSATYQQLGGIPAPGIFIERGQEPYKSLGFLQKNGAVKIVNFDLPAEGQRGVLYLGHYQLNRNRFTDLFELWAENLTPETDVSILPSYDGFNFEKAKPCKRDKTVSKGRLQKYLPLENALSFGIRFEGKFQLSSIEAVFAPAGYR